MQGSQAPAIVIALARGHAPMLTRNLVYTAVTRSQSACVVVAERGALPTALGRVDASRRNTRLVELVVLARDAARAARARAGAGRLDVRRPARRPRAGCGGAGRSAASARCPSAASRPGPRPSGADPRPRSRRRPGRRRRASPRPRSRRPWRRSSARVDAVAEPRLLVLRDQQGHEERTALRRVRGGRRTARRSRPSGWPRRGACGGTSRLLFGDGEGPPFDRTPRLPVQGRSRAAVQSA